MSIVQPKAVHRWAAGGVSGYPLAHPIVGQGEFFRTFQNFIHLVDAEDEKFAHVFAIVAQWGLGKSRLAYELVAQINGSSRGWMVRQDRVLVEANLFPKAADRERYLGLYLRYSQVASEHQNADNWFAYGLVKALTPLALGQFDRSIQGEVARESFDRLLVRGFEPQKLAQALEIEKNHAEQVLYETTSLVTRLCDQAIAYLRKLGIENVLIALDELETAAEAATYGLEADDVKRLDGRAIKLLGKAIKEEDPRKRLPWLRYVALASPAVGHELRQVASIARRFEMVDLTQNSFADVSDFVAELEREGKVTHPYPEGLVEAAYAMSGGNFGWFNVVMANVDNALSLREMVNRPRGLTTGQGGKLTIGTLFHEVVERSSRVRDHVLDHNALRELKLSEQHLEAARELLYGQLPVPLSTFSSEQRDALLAGKNEYDEPVASCFVRVEWDEQACGRALRAARFERKQDVWQAPGVEERFHLRQLLANLETYAIHASRDAKPSPGRHVLLVPRQVKEFVELVKLLYPHEASEDAAKVIWQELEGDGDLEASRVTHIGPSVAMLNRLDLRLRRQSQNSLIFRSPDESVAYEDAMRATEGQGVDKRAEQALTGLMRLLDKHWGYDPVPAGLKGCIAVTTSPNTKSGKGGLLSNHDLWLHPKGKLVLAWVKNVEELVGLCNEASTKSWGEGRYPVLAFTTSRSLLDIYSNDPAQQLLRDASSYLSLFHLSSSEEYALHQVGLATSACKGFKLHSDGFTSSFTSRLNALISPIEADYRFWRRMQLSGEGRIAWPLRPEGSLKESDRDQLFSAWFELAAGAVKGKTLGSLDGSSLGVNTKLVGELMPRLTVTPALTTQGYEPTEQAGLFWPLHEVSAQAKVPPLLLAIYERLCIQVLQTYSFELAQREWFWGYTWAGARPRDVFIDWMAFAVQLGLAERLPDKDLEYQPKTRASLRNLIVEARAWLKEEYPRAVDEMKRVFGEGHVGSFFNPMSSPQPGTRTLAAVAALDRAEKALASLEEVEEKRFIKPGADRGALLLEAVAHRRTILDSVNKVFLREPYRHERIAGHTGMLELNEPSVPLWQAVRRANLYAAHVERVKDKIDKKVPALSRTIEEECLQEEGLRRFPFAVFTLSLRRVADIVQGALQPKPDAGRTQTKQQTEPLTLGYFLRSLDTARAEEKLRQLGREVGVDPSTDANLPLDDIDGEIVASYKALRQSYRNLRTELLKAQDQLLDLKTWLGDPPEDLAWPKDIPPLRKLLERPPLYLEEAESLDEQIEEIRSKHDDEARLGEFRPLMAEAKEMMKPLLPRLNELRGQIVTLENVRVGYLRRLLDSKQRERLERAMSALCGAKGQAPEKPLTMVELEAAGSLKAARLAVSAHLEKIRSQGEEILAAANVPFEAWVELVEALAEGRPPPLPRDALERLLEHQLIEQFFRVPGQRP